MASRSHRRPPAWPAALGHTRVGSRHKRQNAATPDSQVPKLVKKTASMPAIGPPRLPRWGILTINVQVAMVVGIGTGIGMVIAIALMAEQSRALLGDVALDRLFHATESIADQQHGPLLWGKPVIIQEIYGQMVAQHDADVVAAVTIDRAGQILHTYQQDAANPVDLVTFLQADGTT